MPTSTRDCPFAKHKNVAMFCSAVRTCVTPLILGALLIAGCGSGSMQTIAPAQAPQIITQPANQSVPLGQTGAFTVVASGTAPLTYQWSENGAALANSNSPTYTTAIVGPVDSGAKFSVAVTNSAGSINSSDAVLTVGPRSPKAADLRFQQVSAASTLTPPTGSGLHSDVNAGIDQGFQDSIGSPITIGGNCVTPPTGNPYTCDWFFSSFPLPTGLSGLSINYQSTNNYANLNSDLQALALPNTVITSLDLQPASGTYALSSIQTAQTTGFDQSAQTVLPAQFPIAAAQAGAQSRVITAVSFDATGQVFSYPTAGKRIPPRSTTSAWSAPPLTTSPPPPPTSRPRATSSPLLAATSLTASCWLAHGSKATRSLGR